MAFALTADLTVFEEIEPFEVDGILYKPPTVFERLGEYHGERWAQAFQAAFCREEGAAGAITSEELQSIIDGKDGPHESP